MKMSYKNKIRIRQRVIRFEAISSTVVYTATWVDPATGEVHKATGVSIENAYSYLKNKLKAPVRVNDRTMPFYKFWKRRYTK